MIPNGWDFGGASVEDIDWDGSMCSAMDFSWSDGGGTSDSSLSSTVMMVVHWVMQWAVTSSIDGSRKSSLWVTSIEFEDSTSGSVDSGHGAKSRSDKLDSLPSVYLINAYDRFVWISFTLSTNESALICWLNLQTNNDFLVWATSEMIYQTSIFLRNQRSVDEGSHWLLYWSVIISNVGLLAWVVPILM